ncbi:unnamed protein product [Bursaphelenchus okinawaensis]|uniref:Uncharacterized protein n=1 Tax=Bursaphelenchus okinawaensis TaxID=465554 RepID=A0A811LSZ1_9BILA|nr:unnamed protein product [Bursaphelenchus okinawaensis]CAG9127780.1 unnamed protein product [Bursaphelenchus okinawaensis]
MGCKMSSQAARKSAAARQPAGGQEDNSQEAISSVEEEDTEDTEDYLDDIEISSVFKIDICLYGNSTELMLRGCGRGIDAIVFEFHNEYDVIMEKLMLCLKRKRVFILQICLFDECVWSPSLLNVMADYFLSTLPIINNLKVVGDPRNLNVPFIDFYRKLHPIVEHLIIVNPTILRFLIDKQLNSLVLELPLDFSWFPLKYTQVGHVKFFAFSMLEVLCQQDIVMPQVHSVSFFNYPHEGTDSKLILGKVCSRFPSIKRLEILLMVHVQEKNQPVRNHDLFTHTRAVFDMFESILDWNREKLNVTIYFTIYYNGPINNRLARKMTGYIGYECCCKNDKVRVEVSMSKVDLRMFVTTQ